MKRFVEGEDRRQGVLLPEYLDDWVSEENPVRAIDVFVDELDLAALGFEGVEPAVPGRPGRLAPDFKTIADFRKDNGPAIRASCRQFVELCRKVGLFAQAVAAIDGSMFKAVNARDKNFTPAKLKARREQGEKSIARYLDAVETA